MRLKNDTNNYAASFNITPPYQMLVLHSKVLIYPREIYQRTLARSLMPAVRGAECPFCSAKSRASCSIVSPV